MWKKWIILICFASAALLGSNAWAEEWDDGDPGNHLWSSANNWNPNSVPGTDGTANIFSSAVEPNGPVIQNGITTASLGNVVIGWDGCLTITGGTLNTGGLLPGWHGDSTNDGTLKVSGGTANCVTFSVGNVGRGTVSVTGGTIAATGSFNIPHPGGGGSGKVSLDGGTITSPTLAMSENGQLDITGGTLIVNGDIRSNVDTFASQGWLTAYDGRGTIVADYNNTNAGKTTITATEPNWAIAYDPEPENWDGAIAVIAANDANLVWSPGDYKADSNGHDVYLGTSFSDVNDADTSSSVYKGRQDANSYDPGTLTAGQVYYWRIDEVNDANGDSPWKGDVWKFEVQWADRDLGSDNWVATDALGYDLAGYGDCGSPRSNVTLGVFYFLWHGAHGTQGPYDITDLLAENPSDPNYGPVHAHHWWGEPEAGYYLATDLWVIRRNLSMLTDAGVDVLIFDATNAITYPEAYTPLCEVSMEMRGRGLPTPDILFFTHSASPDTVQKLYNEFYEPNLYSDLWFEWDSKPLMLGDKDAELSGGGQLSDTIKNFFTWRKCWYDSAGQDYWTWLDLSVQDYSWHTSGIAEEISVGIATHPTSNIGRSYHDGSQPSYDQYKLTGYEDQGLFFDEQWSRALNVNPEFLFVTGWNEWTAMRFIDTNGDLTFLGVPDDPGDTYFVDLYNQEYSRDAEPMKDGHTDNYYYQLIDNIRRYKGIDPPETPSAATTISIDGSFSDWSSVSPEFRDTIGDTAHRDCAGWGDLLYTDTTGRNDFVDLKVARDSNNLYFYAEAKEAITSNTDPNWMLLFIDSDQNNATGWEGYDYLVNFSVVDGNTTTLRSNNNDVWSWSIDSSNIHYEVSGKEMELSIPRSALNLAEPNVVAIDFHWADNIQDTNDIIEFAVSGDSAPNRRFKYRYDVSPPTGSTLLQDDFEGDLSKWSTDWDLVTTQSFSPTHSVECSSSDNDLITDDLNTSSKVSVRISFKYRIKGIDAGDNIRVQYYDGNNYDDIEEIGDDEENVWLYYSDTIYNSGAEADYFISNFRLKVEGSSVDYKEYLWIDDVLITATE